MVNILHIIYASIYFYLVYMGYYITYKMSRINRGKPTPKHIEYSAIDIQRNGYRCHRASVYASRSYGR